MCLTMSDRTLRPSEGLQSVVGCRLFVVPMQGRLGVVVARAREVVAAFLARGWVARLAACALVSFAAVIWLGALVVLLRVLSVIAFVAAVVWLAWLVSRVWRKQPPQWEAHDGSLATVVRARARRVVARAVSSHDEQKDVEGVEDSQAWEAGLADVHGAVAALNADLVAWQERLIREVERCQHELASRIDALPGLVGRAVPSERTSPPREQPAPAAQPVDTTPDVDFQAVLDEIEADLRLEKVEERERLLAEREERLDRRERDIAAFVNETQARIG